MVCRISTTLYFFPLISGAYFQTSSNILRTHDARDLLSMITPDNSSDWYMSITTLFL